ncbi:MAG: polyprenyl synthetase family protein, partial [Elusimicrobiota bacterium]|nr:polyprenyl synthetase family protein [Elusimicrobiota bacterium]
MKYKKNFNLENFLKEKMGVIDYWLDEILDKNNLKPKIIHKAMRYSVFNGGKRLRPILCYLMFDMFKKEKNK